MQVQREVGRCGASWARGLYTPAGSGETVTGRWATSLCAGPSSGSGVCCPLPLVALTSVLRFLNLASSSSCWRSVRFPRSPQQLVTCLCAGPMGPAGGSVVPRLPYIRSVGRSAD